MSQRKEFLTELSSLINRYGLDNEANTPDYIIAEYLMNCYASLQGAVHARDVHENRVNEHLKENPPFSGPYK